MNITRLILYAGRQHYLIELLREKQITQHYDAILMRLRRGWSGNNAINKPIGKYKQI